MAPIKKAEWAKYRGNPAFEAGLRLALSECEREAEHNSEAADAAAESGRTSEHEQLSERARGASTCAQYIEGLITMHKDGNL